MSPLTTGVAIALTVAAIGTMLGTILYDPQLRAEKLARRVGLALPAEPLRTGIIERTRTARLWVSWGAAGGGLAVIGGLVLDTISGTLRDPEFGIAWLGLAGIVLGAAVGSLLGALASPATRADDQPRVAHAQHRSMRDYLDPIERIGARIAVAVGVVVAAIVGFFPGAFAGESAIAAISAVTLAAVGVVGLVALEWGGRRVILGRPRTATTPEALAWDDALRADDLRTLASAPLMTGTYAAIIAMPALLDALPEADVSPLPVLVLVNGGFMVLVVGGLVLIALALARRPEQFYLRRLWPDVVRRANREESKP